MWLEEQRSLRRMGATYAQSNMLMREWLTQWLKMMKCRLSPGNHGLYERRCRLYLIPMLGHHQMRQLRSEEYTSELQSQFHIVCRLLLENKNRGRCRVRISGH